MMKIKFDLADILAVQSHSYEEKLMTDYIIEQLEYLKTLNQPISYYVDEIKSSMGKPITNIYVTKGTITGDEHYPCFVSHTDTVHDIIDNLYIGEGKTKDGKDTLYGFTASYDEEYGGRFTEPAGCGADDKVGIWACLNLIANLDVCKLAFFAAEEMGCVGSSKADKDFFKDVGYALQTDRKGSSDFSLDINGTEMNDKKFRKKIKDLVKQRGFQFTKTFTTDVGQLKKDGINVCMSNLSSGYYNAHQDTEYVVVEEAENTLRLMYDVARRLGLEKQYHKHEPKFTTYTGRFSAGTQKYNAYNKSYIDRWTKEQEEEDWNRSFSNKPQDTDVCPFCNGDLRTINGHKVCVNPECTACDVQYTTDFWDDYGYNSGGFYEAEQIYPVTNKSYKLLGYYNPSKDKLYYKPTEVVYKDPNQTTIPF